MQPDNSFIPSPEIWTEIDQHPVLSRLWNSLNCGKKPIDLTKELQAMLATVYKDWFPTSTAPLSFSRYRHLEEHPEENNLHDFLLDVMIEMVFTLYTYQDNDSVNLYIDYLSGQLVRLLQSICNHVQQHNFPTKVNLSIDTINPEIWTFFFHAFRQKFLQIVRNTHFRENYQNLFEWLAICETFYKIQPSTQGVYLEEELQQMTELLSSYRAGYLNAVENNDCPAFEDQASAILPQQTISNFRNSINVGQSQYAHCLNEINSRLVSLTRPVSVILVAYFMIVFVVIFNAIFDYMLGKRFRTTFFMFIIFTLFYLMIKNELAKTKISRTVPDSTINRIIKQHPGYKYRYEGLNQPQKIAAFKKVLHSLTVKALNGGFVSLPRFSAPRIKNDRKSLPAINPSVAQSTFAIEPSVVQKTLWQETKLTVPRAPLFIGPEVTGPRNRYLRNLSAAPERTPMQRAVESKPVWDNQRNPTKKLIPGWGGSYLIVILDRDKLHKKLPDYLANRIWEAFQDESYHKVLRAERQFNGFKRAVDNNSNSAAIEFKINGIQERLIFLQKDKDSEIVNFTDGKSKSVPVYIFDRVWVH